MPMMKMPKNTTTIMTRRKRRGRGCLGGGPIGEQRKLTINAHLPLLYLPQKLINGNSVSGYARESRYEKFESKWSNKTFFT